MKLVDLTNDTKFVKQIEHMFNIEFPEDAMYNFFVENKDFHVQQVYCVPIDPTRVEEIIDIKSYVVLVSYMTPDNIVETKYIVLQIEDDLFWGIRSMNYKRIPFDNLNCAIYTALIEIYDLIDPNDVTEENLKRCLDNYCEIVQSL